MISINTSFVSTAKMTDRSVVSACTLGLSGSAFLGSGLSGLRPVRLPSSPLTLPVVEGFEANERPTKALEAGVAAAQAPAYAFAATGADQTKQTQQHLTMWAFRGLEPWSDPA
ncbi:hypothetical protein [Streptomyces roseolilacinus]|uniref:Uncharacterized protein n=1 Tax=Streptomyces roseolilacinus TaxID=66904 RepID=A0A918AVJ2_9ACTN|nr:hypothetical protein [Streptomyces roseolilacinus]GGP88421.1 hypothetical protein GCM10010249_02450 [Streptomyces roseolilacinus]